MQVSNPLTHSAEASARHGFSRLACKYTTTSITSLSMCMPGGGGNSICDKRTPGEEVPNRCGEWVLKLKANLLSSGCNPSATNLLWHQWWFSSVPADLQTERRVCGRHWPLEVPESWPANALAACFSSVSFA